MAEASVKSDKVDAVRPVSEVAAEQAKSQASNRFDDELHAASKQPVNEKVENTAKTEPIAPQPVAPPPPPPFSIELKPYSVTLSVANLEKSEEWYKSKLGFRQVADKKFDAAHIRLAFMEKDDYRVELIEDGQSHPALKRLDPPLHTLMQGMSQFAFLVKDLDATHKALENEGVTFAWEPQIAADLGLKFFFARDNSDNLIQFVQKLP